MYTCYICQLFNNVVAKICDFGLAREKTTDFTTAGNYMQVGTYYYMDPEVIMRRKAAQKYSDIWGMGLSLVELFTYRPAWDFDKTTGNDPIQMLMNKFKKKQKPDGLRLVPDPSRELLDQCLAYDPKCRPTATNMKEAFIGVQGRSP
eukprot:GHVU01187099.1.p1 GENE.GHVU01187099.1~~GHVU01187099.1.p1  ORF type:complete len:147 (-),score=18.53 GHVU01187099.1:190-630(-)